jgi:hypothetical protein
VAEQGVTPRRSRLLRADEQKLRALVAALRRGRFVVVVADSATWPEARAIVAAGVSDVVPDDVHLVTGVDVIRMFSSPAVA